MAKKMTSAQATAARDTLGIDPTPSKFVSVAPRQPGNLPTGPAIEAQSVPVDEPTIWEETKAAFRVDNSIGRLATVGREFKIDLNFDAKLFAKENKARIDTMQGADIEELAADIGSATSAEEAEFRLQNIEKDYAAEMTLYEGGASALGLRLVAAMLDPVDMAIAAATFGTVSGVVKAGRFGKIISGALSAGAAAGGTEALLSNNNVFRDETDVAFATLAGLTLGGALGTIGRRANNNLNKAVEDLANDNIDAAARKLGIDDDSAGAARRKHSSDKSNDPLKSTEEIMADMEAPEFRFKAWNWTLNNLQSKLFYSKSATVRKIASTMFEGGFLKNKKATRVLTAEGRATQLQDVYERGIYAETLTNFKAWSKRLNKGSVRRNFGSQVGEEFYSEVGIAMRGVTKDISPEAIAAAKSIRKQMDGVHALAQKAGVKGFDTDALTDYFPRMLNNNKFTQIRLRIGDDAMQKFYTESILRGGNEIPETLANKIAKAYVRTMRTRAAGIENDLLHGIRLDDVDRLRELFDGYDGIDELLSEIESIKAAEMADRGSVSFGKKRIQFDETYEDLVKGFDGKTETLRFDQLYENDARMVLTRYGRSMHGHIAMAEKLGVRSRGDFETFKQNMATEIEHLGGNPQREIEALEDGYNLLLGQPIARWNPGGDAAKMSRTLSGYNYSTRGGQFGVNALAEAGNIVGQSVMGSVFRQFADLPKMMKRAVDGTLDHKLARFAELTFAPGISVLTKPAVRNLDDLAEDFALSGNSTWLSKFAAKMDPFVKTAGRSTSLASGLGPITDATQRLSAVTYIDKLSRFANGRKMSAGQLSRLRANGIDEEMQERIFAMFRKEGAGIYRKGRLIDVDLAKWTDEGALDAFSQAASREVRNSIQLGDISTSTMLFTHPAGRLLFQFMRFPMDAVNKQFLRGIHHLDAETAKSWSSSMAIGGLAYIGQTQLDYANDDEEREKRLQPENIARVAFMRTGFSSMLPAPLDMGRHVLGMDPAFALGRSSGLSTAIPLDANPSTTAASAAWRFATGITRSAISDDVQFSQADFRAGATLIPGYRLLGMKNAAHALEQQFPETRDQ